MKVEEERAIEFIRKGLLASFLEAPEKFSEHIFSCMAGLDVSLSYGVPIQKHEDPTVESLNHAFHVSEIIAVPGEFLVELLPTLKYVPEWMPGAGFKTLAREWAELINGAVDKAFNLTLKGLNDGTTRDCFASWSLEHNNLERNDLESVKYEQLVKQLASVVFKAGTDTRVATALTFVLAMLLYPEVQQKAQAEIDAVIGLDRLPEFSDRDQLPYISAILKEVLRWNPVLSIGIPHLSTGDDVYNGYYIPSGSIVIANTYAMLHDPEVFPNPEVFDPERFLKDGKPNPQILDPTNVASFGFGRRKCPGAQVALASTYLAFASILTLFDILPELGEEKPTRVEPEFSSWSIIS
ncbi:hypothetical protein NP233_g5093 [Leucocoprinus birnbaumii]|uniref:O-methylsterigmatocystin oxidoreductase n=1 Tax=Leucocoprinus birnbaumii TaxID=56174 RepID=A0AAD5YWQ3_9AGAR|nr:hypothetical protein NP233_g5093 [Leucocoprinus birnbaumii]